MSYEPPPLHKKWEMPDYKDAVMGKAHPSPPPGGYAEGAAVTQQEADAQFTRAAEAAREEILGGLPLIEYLRRTGDEAIDEWAALLAQFGSQNP